MRFVIIAMLVAVTGCFSSYVDMAKVGKDLGRESACASDSLSGDAEVDKAVQDFLDGVAEGRLEGCKEN